jgi:hypothetical protein
MDILMPQLKAFDAGVSASTGNDSKSWELQLQVRMALDLWRSIDSAMEQRSFNTRNDRGEERDQFLRDQHQLYAVWAKPAQALLARAKEAGRNGVLIERLGELQGICEELKWFLLHDVEATISALHDIDAGRRGTSLAELRNELRRRSEAAVH